MTYTMGSLFAGIGGFDLGFERAGFKTSWQVEIDPYCTKVLAKNFPEAERFGDIRECGRHNLKPVDVICGGFPCQDISNAGKRAGIEGERSGLWSEYARIIRELRPAYVVVENVAALLGRGMGVVLGDLAEIGYDAEWEVISASDVGAPHLRERIWIVGYPLRFGHLRPSYSIAAACDQEWNIEAHRKEWPAVPSSPESDGQVLADSTSERRREARGFRHDEPTQRTAGDGEEIPNPNRGHVQGQFDERNDTHIRQEQGERSLGLCGGSRRDSQWEIEPNVGRVAHGIPKRVDRLRGLGNAVVPQIPEMIARRIKQALEAA